MQCDKGDGGGCDAIIIKEKGMIHDLYALKQHMNNAGVLYCYCGPVTQEFTETTGRTLRRKTALGNTSPAMAMRIFAVFVEMVQNICLYSMPEHGGEEEGPEKMGIIVVGREQDTFFINSGNRILLRSASRIEELLCRLQKMDKKELKSYYKEKRRQDPDPESKGAGLGFIEIARKATDFSYSIQQVDDRHAFFSLKVTL